MDNIIKAANISKRFGELRAVDAIDLQVQAGTILGLIGPNGAGKTTLMDVITGKTRCDRGSVYFGQNI